MVTLVKHEWHQVDRQYCLELDEDLLSEIYPDLDEDEIANMLQQIENGEVDFEDVINEAWENDVDIDWDFQYDDCWTDRKGGYEVTYELGDEDSYHHEPAPPEPTHKCTKCKWVGQSYDADWVWPEDENSEEKAKKVCPMCDSDTELTEVGIKEDTERKEREARWAKEEVEEEDDTDERRQELHDFNTIFPKEDDIVSQAELEEALEELKREFDALMVHTHKCTECEWTGTEEDCEKEGICPDCCAYTEEIVRDDE